MRLRSWRTKALAQRVFSILPRGQTVNYQFQRRVFRNLPISDDVLRGTIELGAHHLTVLSGSMRKPVSSCQFYEFGAGWDLAMPLVLHSLGVERQIVVDIRRLLRADLVFDIAERLRDMPERLERRPPRPSGGLDAYLASLGIDYRAPCDARSTGLAASSIDCITSTNTLEHIPQDDITQILRECRRVLSPGGHMSFQVDHQDHYSYFDPALDRMHFLRYSEHAWHRYNSSLHFQNRLRHSEVLDLYSGAGFTIVRDESTHVEGGDVLLRSTPLAPRFAALGVTDLTTATSRTLLRPSHEPQELADRGDGSCIG